MVPDRQSWAHIGWRALGPWGGRAKSRAKLHQNPSEFVGFCCKGSPSCLGSMAIQAPHVLHPTDNPHQRGCSESPHVLSGKLQTPKPSLPHGTEPPSSPSTHLSATHTVGHRCPHPQPL